MTASGVISGTGSVTKDGASTLFFDAENTYTGATYITSGIVQVQKSNALGSLTAGTGSSNTTVSDGAVIQIFGTSINIPEAITVFGTGASNRGVIRNFTGSTGVNALTNTITLNSNARINVDAGTLSLTGTLNGTSIAFGTYSLSAGVNTATSMGISGVLTGTGNLTKDSLGTLILSGSNTGYSGAITVYNGVMNIQNANALGTTDVATNVLSSAALQIQNNITVPEATINITGTGINSDGAIRNMSGTNALSGTISLTGISRINVDAGTLSMTGASNGTAITLGSNNINTGVASGTSLYVSGAITGSGTLTKDITGTLYLSGTNTLYTGAISVFSGVMNIQNDNALGSSSVATTVTAGAALQIQNNITIPEQNIYINGGGVSSDGAIRVISGSNQISGVVNLSSAARINVDAGTLTMTSATSSISFGTYTLSLGGASTNTIAGTLNGSGTVVKDGAGTVVLNANNGTSYTGPATINAGYVSLMQNNALGNNATTTVSSPGTVQIIGNSINIPEPIIIEGNGVATNQGAIRNPSGNNTWSGLITLGADARIVSGTVSGTISDSLLVIGNIATSTYTLTTEVERGMRIDGVISGTALTKVGNDTLILGGTNTYTGLTTISNGVVEVKNGAAFGAVNGTTTVANNAAMKINGSLLTIPEGVNIIGSGINSTGAIRNLLGTNALSGTISLTGNARINVDAGTLSMTGTTSLYLNTFTLNTGVSTATSMYVSGALTGNTTSNLTKDSTGILYLSGNSASYSGAILIYNGVLNAQNANALGAISGSTTINTNAALQVQGGITFAAEPISISGTGISSDGAIRNISGSNTLAGTISLTSAARINVDAGTLSMTGTTALALLSNSLNAGVASGTSMYVSGLITGTASSTFTKDSTGTLYISGSNTGYNGAISVYKGVLNTQNNNALGTTTGATTVVAGAALQLNGVSAALSIPEPITINGMGINNDGAIRLVSTSNAATLTGTITVASASRINTDVTAGTNTLTISTNGITNTAGLTFGINNNGGITVSGPITGSDANNSIIIKDGTGAGKLIFSSANTYAGTTSITSGVLQVQNATALGASGSAGTTVGTGAALEISGGTLSIPEGITINGTGISSGGAIRNILGTNALSGTISLTSASRINVDAGTLSMTSSGTSIALDINTLNAGVASGTSMYVSGALTGAGDFTKDSTGTLYVSGNNSTYSGAITVYKGVMNIQNSNALGTTNAVTNVLSSAALQIQNNITVPEATINIIGTGINSDGAIRNMSGTNALSGTINLTGNARINSDAGTLSMTNNTTSITLAAYNLNIGGLGSGITSVIGAIGSTGAGILTKDGTSTSYLYLTGNNTYTGNTVVSSGVLNIQHANALGTTVGTTSISSGAALEIQGGITLTEETINVSSTGITSTTGGIRSISGNNTIPGAITSAAASRINVDQDALTLTNSTNALILTSTNIIGGAGNINVTGKVTGASSLTMDGTGILSLSASTNDYTGQTIITSGMVKINNDNSLGNKTSSTTNNTIVSGTGTVYLDGNAISFAEPFTISSPGTTIGGVIQGAIRNPSGVNTLAGPITLAGNASIISTGTGTSDSLLVTGNINTGTSTNTLTIDVTKGVRLSNIISGTGGFTKNGSDTLLLYNSGANTYSGITTINGGVVRINSATAFGNASSTSTAHTNITAGTLLVDISGFTIAEPFTIAGDGVSLSGVSQGAIKTLYGINNLTGQITLNASAKILSGIFSGTTSDSLNLATIVTSSPYALTIFTNVGTKAKGIISGSGSLIKEGLDTLLLSAVNTFTGSTKVTSGSLLAGIDNALSTGSEFIFNGGTYSSGGFSNTLGKLSVLDDSKINIRFLQVHGITYTGAASFVAGKDVIIYGWSGLTAPGVSKTGELIASNPTQVLVYLRSTGDIGKSKSGGLTKYGQVVSASIGADFNGRIFFTNSTRLTDFQLNRLRFYVDPSAEYTSPYRYFSSTQNASTFELLANDTIKVEPVDVIPTSSLTTSTVNPITNTTAVSGGNITATTDDVVIARGVVWSTTSSPTIDLSTKTEDGLGSGTFTSNISGLTLSTTYYVRAYATNSNGTDYGSQRSFTTLRAPTVAATSAASSITYYTAAMAGNISSDNGLAISARGFVYSTAATTSIPSLTNSVTTVSGTTGSYTGTITGLIPNTTYYVSSYATNSQGTTYGTPVSFSTP